MRKLLTFVAFCILTLFSALQAQPVVSSCMAPDSIAERYRTDADQLAYFKIYRQHLAEKDSVEIPQAHTDTVLRALLAVYNATSLPARDSVVDMFPIHVFPRPILNRVSLAADSSLPWMVQLRAGHIPTGDATVDSLLSRYHFTAVTGYTTYSNLFYWHVVHLQSDSNYNVNALVKEFQPLPGMFSAEIESPAGDGSSIWDSIYSDHVELTYELAWGDCPSGCTVFHAWRFKVYFDCSVEFMGSYGAPVPYTGINELSAADLQLSPNPFTTSLQVKGVPGAFRYGFINLLGEEVLQGVSPDGVINGLDALPAGLYLLRVVDGERLMVVKVMK